MADAADPTSGGEEAFAYFYTTEIPDATENLLRFAELASQRGLPELQVGALKVLEGMLADVNRVAVEYAGIADGLIIAKMFQTQSRNRPLTGNMESHVRSQPGLLGSIRVALISELDKIVNQSGKWGPFWRAQEYGTGSDEVASQEGRPLFGTFEPSGEPPEGAQAGLGEGHDLAFIPQGSNPGYGVISVELPGRHFLRDGSEEAGERYKAAMEVVQQKWLKRFEELARQIKPTRGGGAFRGIIEA